MPLSDTLTREVSRRADFECGEAHRRPGGGLVGLCAGLGPPPCAWPPILRPPATTTCWPPPSWRATWPSIRPIRRPSAAAEDPTEVRKAHVESFLAWMSESCLPRTTVKPTDWGFHCPISTTHSECVSSSDDYRWVLVKLPAWIRRSGVAGNRSTGFRRPSAESPSSAPVGLAGTSSPGRVAVRRICMDYIVHSMVHRAV